MNTDYCKKTLNGWFKRWIAGSVDLEAFATSYRYHKFGKSDLLITGKINL